MSLALEVSHLYKSYGAHSALEDVNFALSAHQTLAIVGPNGAGKTTLLQILCGVLRPTAGQVMISGFPIPSKPARRALSLSPQFLDFPVGVTVSEVIQFVVGHYAEPIDLDRLYSVFGIFDLLKRRACELSGGEKKRVSLTMALAHKASVTILDEPSAALDFRYQKAFLQLIGEMRGERALVFTTHDLCELRHLPDRVITLDKGRVVGDELVSGDSASRVLKLVRLRSSLALPSFPTCLLQTAEGGVWKMLTFEPEALLLDLLQQQIAFTELEVYEWKEAVPKLGVRP